jgi:hypothetical protein
MNWMPETIVALKQEEKNVRHHNIILKETADIFPVKILWGDKSHLKSGL